MITKTEQYMGNNVLLEVALAEAIYRITYEIRGKLIASAMFVGHGEIVVLSDIVVYEEKYRRQGIASAMMRMAQNTFPNIYTGESTTKGRKLCLKHGFKVRTNKDGSKYMVWRKDEAVEDDRGEGTPTKINDEEV